MILFVDVFLASVGLMFVISRQTSLPLELVSAASTIIVGIAEALIVLVIGAEAFFEGSDFLLKSKTNISTI